jgi:hypothetical protein
MLPIPVRTRVVFSELLGWFGLTDRGGRYSCAGGIYRGFADMGEVWAAVGKARGLADVRRHGAELLAIAPKLRAALQASIAKTSFTISDPGSPRHGKTCVRNGAGKDGGPPNLPTATSSCSDGGGRSYPELFYAGVLTRQQVDDIYETLTTSNNSHYGTRPMTMGCAGYNNKQVTFWAYGIPYGLLQHDMVERFLLHYFAMSAHTYTRGTWTTPEASHPDRDQVPHHCVRESRGLLTDIPLRFHPSSVRCLIVMRPAPGLDRLRRCRGGDRHHLPQVDAALRGAGQPHRVAGQGACMIRIEYIMSGNAVESQSLAIMVSLII